jgi:hypothetical protein
MSGKRKKYKDIKSVEKVTDFNSSVIFSQWMES